MAIIRQSKQSILGVCLLVAALIVNNSVDAASLRGTKQQADEQAAVSVDQKDTSENYYQMIVDEPYEEEIKAAAAEEGERDLQFARDFEPRFDNRINSDGNFVRTQGGRPLRQRFSRPARPSWCTSGFFCDWMGPPVTTLPVVGGPVVGRPVAPRPLPVVQPPPSFGGPLLNAPPQAYGLGNVRAPLAAYGPPRAEYFGPPRAGYWEPPSSAYFGRSNYAVRAGYTRANMRMPEPAFAGGGGGGGNTGVAVNNGYWAGGVGSGSF